MLAFGLARCPTCWPACSSNVSATSPATQGATGLGLLVLGFGVFGLYHAPSLVGDLWRGVVCVT